MIRYVVLLFQIRFIVVDVVCCRNAGRRLAVRLMMFPLQFVKR
jgi:hypothetical protein